MKILVIDNSSVVKKNNSYYTNNLNALFINELKLLNNEITYFQFAAENKNSINVFDLRANGIIYKPIRMFTNKFLRYIFGYLAIIPSILKNNFIYFYYPSSFKYATYICRLFCKKYGLYIRGGLGIYDSISLNIYSNAFAIFTVSDYFTNKINGFLGKDNANTIRPMITFTDKDIVRDRIYQLKQRFNILFLGRIARDKGIEELLIAVSILKKNKYQFELYIVGSGEFIEEAKQISTNLQINDVVKFTGPVYEIDKIKQYYLNSDIYILPSYHEGFPRTLYEAMIFGTPIITTLVGGIHSLMKDNYNCKSIDSRSIRSICDGLIFAFQNYSKMIHFAENGTITVSKIVDSKRMTHAQHLNKILEQ